jgi:DNA replication protein DnaC
MDDHLREVLRYLKLYGLMENWENYLELAEKQKLSNTRLLTEILEKEYALKKETARKQRIKRATILEQLCIDTYPFELQPKLNKKKVMQIFDSMDYMEKKKNVFLVGPTGCGKSGLASSLLIHALNSGYSGKFIGFPELIDELHTSVADHSQKRIIRKFATFDCLVVDELGYLELDPTQVGLFFTLMSKRHKQASTIITSNLGFKDWAPVLKNKPLTVALIDRLTSNCHVINMKDCVSLRQDSSEN